MTMKRSMSVLLAAALGVGMLATGASASELTVAQQARKAACEAIDPGENVVATYTAGSGAAGANDSCQVVSRSTSYEEAVTQVNNPRAAKAVERVVRTESIVETTQAYRWNTAAEQAGGQRWVASGDPITEEELLAIEECLRNPARELCG
jgi:hypothetical protein